jgi:RNA polymerase sigma-70 factor (ECF subfamily)
MERDRLVREFQRGRFRLIAYIRALVGDPDLTEDLFQETTVVVLQKLDSFEEGRDLQAWCRGIARNLVLRHRSQARRLVPFTQDRLIDLVDAAFAERPPAEGLEEHRSQLRKCLEQLAAGSREMLDLRYGADLSLRDIAGRLQRTEGAVQVGLSRVRKWLADCVARRLQPEAGA